MITVQILEPDDLIDAEDWCRPLRLTSMSGGHSDGYSFKSQYSGLPENNVQWCKVKLCIGSIWFGHKTRDFNYKMNMKYEFVRGNVPATHRLDMQDYTRLTDD